jgi:hypothetical protein
MKIAAYKSMDRTALRRKNLIQQVKLTQNAMDIIQLKDGYYRLPLVPKTLQIGPKGGIYYENVRGKKIYLKQDQRKMRDDRRLRGCIGPVCDADIR